MPRKRINSDSMPARFPPGTLRRIVRVLAPKETRAAFLREAVKQELRKRERRR